MRKGSSTSAPIVGVLAIIGFLFWVLSQVWLYLVIGAASAATLWMVWVLARNFRAGAATTRLVPVAGPQAVAPPNEPFRPVLVVDPKVFDDPALTKAAALRTFAAWTRSLPMAPTDPSELVRSIDLRIRIVGRTVSEIADRKVEWKEALYSGSAIATEPKMAADVVDPWAFSTDALRTASRYVASCTSCSGSSEIACPSCSGATRVTCSNCQGSGKAYGIAANGSRRLMNCKTCARKGSLECSSCSTGRVRCPNCKGTGRKERWLEIVETSRSEVRMAPDDEHTRAFPWGADGTAASPQELDSDAKVLTETTSPGALSKNQIADLVDRSWLDAHWRSVQPKLRPSERVQAQTLLMLEVPSIELAYALAGVAPTVISFEGRRMLAPPASRDSQFSTRARRIQTARYALIGLALIIPLAYLLRGSYFRNGWLAALLLCSAGSATALYYFLSEFTLGRRAAHRWAATTALGTLLLCGFAVGAEPSARAAKRYLSSGQVERARTELMALGHPDEASRSQIWADLHVIDVSRSDDAMVARNAAAMIPATLPQRAVANRRLYDLTEQTVLRDLATRQSATAKSVLTSVTSTIQDGSGTSELVPKLSELTARVADEEYSECMTDECRWTAAMGATRAASSQQRSHRLDEIRARVLEALTLQSRPGESPLSKIQRLDATLRLGRFFQHVEGDVALGTKASEAVVTATEERTTIPLINAEPAVVGALLGVSAVPGARSIGTATSSVAGYCSMRGGRCAGMYIVGSDKDGRVLNDSLHADAATRLLSQAVGRHAALPDPPTQGGRSATATRTHVGAVPILARWRDAQLVELRVGDATP